MSGLRWWTAGARSVPMLRQSEAAECGLVCLAMVAGAYGYETDLAALRRRFSVSLKGSTLFDMLGIAERLGLAGRGLRLEPAELPELRTPCILHVDLDHFVVLVSARGGTALIHDPATGRRRWPAEEISRRFTGVALELSPTPAFEKRREVLRLSARTLWGHVPGLSRALLQAILLSVVLQLFVIASPFYMQLAVDEAVVKGDDKLLASLALGFTLLLAIKLAAQWLRGRVLLAISTVAGFQMRANVFHRLVRLPLDFFEKRYTGDPLSRAHSVEPIGKLLSDGLVAAIVDGCMALITLLILLVYSAQLTAIVGLAFIAYVGLRLALFRIDRRRQEDMIQADAKHETTFLETARAIQSIKLFGREREREARYQGQLSRAIARRVGMERLHLDFAVCHDLFYGVEQIVIIYLAARMALAGEMTVGMVFAFMAYKDQLLNSATRMVEVGLDWRMLDLHLDRLSDIVLSPPEPGLDTAAMITHSLQGGIAVRDLRFRYADTEPDVVCGVDLQIVPGEFVAVTGPSGCGKTTLLKLMLGLLQPTGGEVLVDGVPLQRIGAAVYRAQIAAVMQEDQLLSGTLADNICSFDTSLDQDWMRHCARLAGIDDEIMAMAMNYNSLVGDMGSALSGGQKQRVLLARALYRRPRILFMDEGTSQLDLPREREINKALASLQITRIVIAHRPDTVAAADRVIGMDGGRVVRDLREPVQPSTGARQVPARDA